jgi:hypothetical protein
MQPCPISISTKQRTSSYAVLSKRARAVAIEIPKTCYFKSTQYADLFPEVSIKYPTMPAPNNKG